MIIFLIRDLSVTFLQVKLFPLYLLDIHVQSIHDIHSHYVENFKFTKQIKPPEKVFQWAVKLIVLKITYYKQYSKMIKRPILLLPCSRGRRITWWWCVLWWRVNITGPLCSLRSVVVICQNDSEWSGTSGSSVTRSSGWGCGTVPDLASIWRPIQKIDFLKQFERK